MEKEPVNHLFGAPIIMDRDMLKEVQPIQIEVVKVAEAIGYGEGPISYQARKEAVGEGIMQLVEKLIESPEIIVPIGIDKYGNSIEDDGCGDGRWVAKIFKGTKTITAESLHRAKVFGGGLTMGLSARIGNGEVASEDLNHEFENTIALFEEQGIGYGAHTDQHAHGEKGGCGAIDNAPLIIENVVKYEDEIRGTIAALGYDDEHLDDVFKNFSTSNQEFRGKKYAGSKVIDDIKHHAKFVKELGDDHLEAFILLSYVEGHTVNQQLIREKTDNKVQVFAVDVWRMSQIAEKMYPGDLLKQSKAFKSELIYTLATAATLTPGDLPVRVITQPEHALAA